MASAASAPPTPGNLKRIVAASLENRRLYEESEARLLAAAPEAARQVRFDGTMP